MDTPKISFIGNNHLPIYSILPDRLRVTVDDHNTNEYYHGWNVGVMGNDPHSADQTEKFLEGFMAGSAMRLHASKIPPNRMWTLTDLKDGIAVYYCDIMNPEYAYFYGWNAAVNSVQKNVAAHDIITIHGEASTAHEKCLIGYDEALDQMDTLGVEQIFPLKSYVSNATTTPGRIGAGVSFKRTSVASKVRDRTETSSVTEEIALQRPSEYM